MAELGQQADAGADKESPKRAQSRGEERRLNKNIVEQQNDHLLQANPLKLGANRSAKHVAMNPKRKASPSGISSQGAASSDYGACEGLSDLEQLMKTKQQVGKMCHQVQFIPILLMWCPNLLQGKPCNCGYKSLSSLTNIKEQIRAFLNIIKHHSKEMPTTRNANRAEIEQNQLSSANVLT